MVLLRPTQKILRDRVCVCVWSARMCVCGSLCVCDGPNGVGGGFAAKDS